MDVDLRGKRKKKKNTCPNPLFVKWLTEWRDEAAERGLKSQYCYKKALASLKKYPLVFTSGKECKVLENFGDKICKMLDVKLAEHISIYGSPTELQDAAVQIRPKKCSKPAPNCVPAKPRDTTIPRVEAPCHSDIPVHCLSDSDTESSPPEPKRRRRSHSSGDKEYVPAYRSGPYALLLTLYRNYQRSNGKSYMMKTDLIREAQHLADCSFTMADPGCRYTAWSSMGTLIRKGLVIKESSPAKYSITNKGCELAHKLDSVNPSGLTTGQRLTTDLSPERRQPPPALPSVPADSVELHILTESSRISSNSGLSHAHKQTNEDHTNTSDFSSRLQYWYVTEAGDTTRDKDKAAVVVDESFGLGFLIKCIYQDLLKSGKRYKLDISRPLSDANIFAYVQDTDADEFANAPLQCKENTTQPKPSVPTQNSSSGVDKSESSVKIGANPSEVGSAESVGLSLSERLGSLSKPTVSVSVSSAPCEEGHPSVDKCLLSSTTPLFTLKPGSFDVVLCVDNQEFYGNGGGKNLFADLIKNGVTCDLRKLQVGDFLWVAREKVTAQPGGLGRPEGRELVLDHIIERKRMDDLVSSCIDGRFKEQKFRLKQCGLRCPLYLIEDYGSGQNFSMPEDRLKQTMANTQVVDGFLLKRTRDTKESVAYLTLMTRYLQSYYQSKTLQAFPAEVLTEISRPYDIRAPVQQLLEFKQFNEASVKTKNLTIREMFGKQIIQMYRLSAEGAKAIVDHYPTPSHLISAYGECRTEKEKEELLSKIKSGKAGR